MVKSFAVANPDPEPGRAQKKTRFNKDVKKLAVNIPQNLLDVPEDNIMETENEGEDANSSANTSTDTVKNDDNWREKKEEIYIYVHLM